MPPTTQYAPPRAGIARPCAHRLGWGVVLWAGLASIGHAKTCDEMKAEIARRMDEAGLRGYSLEIVPAGAVASGARVVGNCVGGSRKIVYRRFALRQAQPLVSEISPPSPKPQPSPAAPEPEPRPMAQLPSQPKAVSPAAVAVPPVVPEPAPVAAPPEPAAPATQPETTPSPTQAPERTAADKVIAAEAVPAPQANPAPPSTASLAPDFLIRHWAWLVGVIALSLLVWVWRWRGGVDAAGLPRGPRL